MNIPPEMTAMWNSRYAPLYMLISREGIQNDFSGFETLQLEEVEVQLSEGFTITVLEK